MTTRGAPSAKNGSPRCGACAHRLSHDASAAYATVRRCERPRARSGNVPIGGRLNRTPAGCVVTAYRRIRCVRRSHGRDWHRDRGSLASDRPTPLSKELAARVVSLDRGDPRRTGSRDRPPVRGTDQPVHGARRADGLRHCARHGNRRPGRWARPGTLGREHGNSGRASRDLEMGLRRSASAKRAALGRNGHRLGVTRPWADSGRASRTLLPDATG